MYLPDERMNPPKELGWKREKLGETYTRDQLVKRTQELLEEYPVPRSKAINKLLEEMLWAIQNHLLTEQNTQHNNPE
jgi:hypothetical protein